MSRTLTDKLVAGRRSMAAAGAGSHSMTGLGNRWALDDDLASRLRSTAISRPRHPCDPEPAALLLADISRFKRYEDRYGHLAVTWLSSAP